MKDIGMTTVFGLYHEYSTENDEDEEKLIGLYSSHQKAVDAIGRLKDKPGFRDFPDGFKIYELRLDHDGWVEGFVRGDPSDFLSGDT